MSNRTMYMLLRSLDVRPSGRGTVSLHIIDCFLYVLGILMMVALSIVSVIFCFVTFEAVSLILVGVLGVVQLAAIAFYVVISCCCGCGLTVQKLFGGFQIVHLLSSLACMILTLVVDDRSKDGYAFWPYGCSLGFIPFDIILAVSAFACHDRICEEDSDSSSPSRPRNSYDDYYGGGGGGGGADGGMGGGGCGGGGCGGCGGGCGGG